MNKLRRISVIFMSLLMLFAMTISVSAATKVQDGIEVTLNTNLQSYDKGEEIVTAITVKNTNSYAVTDVDISCVAPAGYALTDSVGASTIPVLGANETVTLTVNLTPISSTATGDNSNMVLWGVVLVLALAGAVTLGIVYRKRWKGMLSLILCMAMLMSLLPANMLQVSATDASGMEAQSTVYPEFEHNRITVEAEECITTNSVYTKYELTDASGGHVAYCASGNYKDSSAPTTEAQKPAISYTFNAPKAGSYDIWLRVMEVPNNSGAYGSNNIWYALDNATTYTRYNISGTDHQNNLMWVKLTTVEATEEGTHTVNLFPRGRLLYIDKLLISNDADLVPTGDGEYVEPPKVYPEFANNRITVEAEDCIKNTDMYFVVNSESIVDDNYKNIMKIDHLQVDYDQDGNSTLSDVVALASGNAGVYSTTYNTTGKSTIPATPGLSYTFKAPEDGIYCVWVRALTRSGGGDNLWFDMTSGDGSADYAECGNSGSALKDNYGTYAWYKLYSSEMTAGEHTINISVRKQHVYIDKLLISNNIELVPTGDGEYVAPTKEYPEFANNRITAEAEACEYKATVYQPKEFQDASAGIALECIGNNTTDKSTITEPALTYDFKVPKTGRYYVWIRMQEDASYVGAGDSIWVAMDEGAYAQSNCTEATGAFTWKRISASELTEGIHVLNLYPREKRMYLDKILITDKASLIPTGDGEYVEGAVDELIYSVPEVSPTVGEHPRVWFLEEDVPGILNNLDHPENSAMYASHLKYLAVDNVDGKLAASASNYVVYPLTVAKSNALQYALTKADDAEAAMVYGEKAVSIMKNFLDTVTFKSDADYSNAGNTIYTIGLIYDWCYDLLDDEEKEYFIDQGLYLAGSYLEVGWPPTKLNGWGGHGSENQLICHLLAFGISIYDEKPYVYNTIVGRLQDEYRSQRKDLYYNAHKLLYGSDYGITRFEADVSAMYMLSKLYPEGSPNKNFWQNDGIHYMPYWYLYATKPDGFYLVEGDSFAYNVASPKNLSNHAIDYAYAILGNYYGDGYLKYAFMQEREDLSPLKNFLEILIVNNPDIEPISTENLPLSKYFDYPAGQYIARTGWDMGKTSDDVVVSMSVNEVTLKDGHNHADAGEFEIYYKGNLATDSGYYKSNDSNAFATEYWHNYYRQTIAHNCMLILDPDEPISNFIHNGTYRDIPNTGGQISTSRQGTTEYPEDAENFEENEDFNTGSVLGHEVDPYDEMKPDYTYLKGDLSGAYSDKVANYERSFMFLNLGTTDEDTEVPAVLIVFDHVVSSNASFKKTYLLHGINVPEIDGIRTVLKRTEEGYNGKLVNDTLLPKSDNVTITAVGTENENVFVVGNTTINSPGSDVGVNEGGGIRTEISPIQASTEDYFLNVMQMSDADSTEEPLEATLIEADTHTGVMIADRVVMFGKTNERIADTVTFSFGEEESTLSARSELSEKLEASSTSSKKGILSWFEDLFLVVKAGDNIGTHKLSVSETITIAGKQVKVESVVTYNLPSDEEEAEDEKATEVVPDVTATPEASAAPAASEAPGTSASPEASAAPAASEAPEISATPSPSPEVEEAIYQITVADLKAGTWSYTNEDGSAAGTVVVTEDGGVAAFEGPKGAYTLTYVNESTDRNITQPTYELEDVPVKVRFNNYYLFSEEELFTENNEVMIPVNTIADALNTNLLWDETEKAATMSRYDRTVVVTADEDIAVVNGENRTLSVKARMVDDTLFVPLTFVAEAFLAQVKWVAYTKTAIVTDNVKPPVTGYINVVNCWWDAGIIVGDGTDGYYTLDNDTSTSWGTGAAEPGARFIAYDFGEVKDVNTIEVLWLRPYQRYFTFEVLISEDGENWTNPYENNGNDGKLTSTLVEQNASGEYDYQPIELPEGTKTRYIKLVTYGNTKPNGTGTYATSITEIRFK